MCNICDSGLLADINKKSNWRPDRVIKWAGRRGLKITEKQLQRHFIDHLAATSQGPSRHRDKSAVADRADRPLPKILTDVPAGTGNIDSSFLNEVVKRVYNDLSGDKFELKLEHGFKAIEIRQKIADATDVEKLLLDLLNEIRHQELSPSAKVPG